MKYFKKLLGEKIYLSPRCVEDAEKYVEWLNDFETTDYIGRSSKTMTIEAEKKYLESKIESETDFGIIELKTDKLIGTCSIENINHINRTATVGIFIGDKESRNKGYGTEALNLILDYGFNYFNLNNICLNVFSFNERAIKCYEKCGFKMVGTRRKCIYINGNYHDYIIMDILKDEFKVSYIKNKKI